MPLSASEPDQVSFTGTLPPLSAVPATIVRTGAVMLGGVESVGAPTTYHVTVAGADQLLPPHPSRGPNGRHRGSGR